MMAWIFGVVGGAVLLVLLVSFGCFCKTFFVPYRNPKKRKCVTMPGGDIYAPYRESMERWAREALEMPHELVKVTSYDGLTLCGRLYEYAPEAPIELMFHGYRGNALGDLAGGIARCFAVGRSVLLVDQRCCGDSDGHVITFGIREHRDCLTWLAYLTHRFGEERKVILTGVSMGAATVLLAAGTPLPNNVIGVLADCGFDSAKDIIGSVIRQMGLPVWLAYPFVRLGARLFGGFDLEEYTALQAMARCSVPVIFFHGEQDDFVPCEMSRRLYEACVSRKQLVTVPGAGHGLSYPVEEQGYLSALEEFFGEEASYKK